MTDKLLEQVMERARQFAHAYFNFHTSALGTSRSDLDQRWEALRAEVSAALSSVEAALQQPKLDDLNTSIADRMVELAYALDDQNLPLAARISYVKRELGIAARELLLNAGPALQQEGGGVPSSALRDAAYDQIDRFLRNNMDDMDYADYSQALDLIYTTAPSDSETQAAPSPTKQEEKRG
jgi:hypothetical protein